MGGLSVVRALQRLAPNARLVYAADAGHAPYGERDEAHIQQRSLHVAGFLRQQGAAALVVACNTATAMAVAVLREAFPALPVVGVEPGIKPAVALTRNGRIGVLATQGTLNSEKFAALVKAHAGSAQVVLQPCPGLAYAIEQGDVDDPQVRSLVKRYCEPLREAAVDTVVLGCTHYPFAAHHIRAEMGDGVNVVDTADAVARRALDVCPAAVHEQGPSLALWSSGSVEHLRGVAARWLDRADLGAQDRNRTGMPPFEGGGF